MGNCVSVSLSLDRLVDTASQCIVEKVGYTHNLKKNLDDLKTAMELLMEKQDDLSRKLKSEEDRGFKALPEVKGWFNRVEAIEKTVKDLLDDRDVELQRLFLCGFCSKSLISSHRYGKSVFLMLKEVEKLKREDFPVIAEKAQTHEVQERPHETAIVGQETMLDKAWNHLKEEGVGIMGMYGMGGVGKTTLLTQIHNKLREERCEFDFVIWIVVSKELHVEKIQHVIAKKVGADQHEEWKERDNTEKGIYLFNFLRKKKFILLLDDIWEKVDLVKIGVPDPRKQRGCKVVFTTRSLDVCSRMGVENPMEIKCLEDEVAFDLFRKKVGEITLGSDPGIPKLARKVAKKCRGLPLALNVIGETMSCKRTIQEWEDAIFELESHEVKFADMEDKILVLLKFSYDSLKEEQAKACLLYCALFPEDAKIYKETLIDYWMCDGVIAIDDGCGGIEKAEKKGYTIIGGLVRASLLMDPGDEDGKGVVRMHDVVREMAIWIASEIEKEAFIVHANIGLYKIPKIKNWNVVRKMSLMCNRIGHLEDRHVCSELTTLLLQCGSLKNISSEFFRSMPRLSVLDLSGNEYLKDLPNEMSELVSLQYLNLSYTCISHLAKDLLQGLRKLIHLDLEYTRYLRSIAGISSVQNLKVLKLFGSRWNFDSIEELEALEHLEILTVSLYDTTTYTTHKEQFMNSHKLMSCTQLLWIRYVKESFGISLQGTMNKLREFNVRNGTVSDIKIGKKDSFSNLVKVHVDYIEGLKDLTFLIFVPRLRILEVGSSEQIEDIINKEKACEVNDPRIVPFQELSEIHFSDLPQLKSIYWSPLPFPYLKVIKIMECPNLKKLPLDSKCGKQDELVLTYSEEEWLESVEWKDEDTKRRFLSSCQWTRCIHSYEPFYHSGYDYEDDDAFRSRSTDRKLLLNSR